MMLPPDLNIPVLGAPYGQALHECLEFVFSRYEVLGIVAAGTIVRGTGDPRSDLDIHVLHSGSFRERIQHIFNGVPAEIFVNPPSRIPAYFEEDVKDRRPIAPHIFGTGVVVYDPSGAVSSLVAEALSILANAPESPAEGGLVSLRYSLATEFEDVEDLAERDPAAAGVLLGGSILRLVEYRVAFEPGWRPRAKDLMDRLREIDPESANFAELAASASNFNDRLIAAQNLCLRVTGAAGFFEWESPREQV